MNDQLDAKDWSPTGAMRDAIVEWREDISAAREHNGTERLLWIQPSLLESLLNRVEELEHASNPRLLRRVLMLRCAIERIGLFHSNMNLPRECKDALDEDERLHTAQDRESVPAAMGVTCPPDEPTA